MAVTKRLYRVSEKYFQDSSIKIAELGAQFVMEEEWGSYGPPYFRNVFSHLDITSFDFYPENGATVLDLSEKIDEKYFSKFDMVTNYGTTEHVQSQYICWENIFNMLKEGGISLNAIPKKGHWEGHCKYYFDEETLEAFKDDFDIVEFQDVDHEDSGALFYFVMRKKHGGKFKTDEKDLMSRIQIIENYDDKQGH